MTLRRLCFFFALPSLLLAQSALRPWKDTQGRVIQAAFVSATADSVTIRMADGKEHTLPLSRFSPEDQAFAKSQSASPTAPAASDAADAARLPIEKRVWPQQVEVSARSVEITPTVENAPARQFIYQSEGFEFTSQAKIAGSVMKEVARTFEATKKLMSELPWGIVCKPPAGMERYKAELYETRNDYITAGGPVNSGGVYLGGRKVFMIPFPSLGLEMRGKTWFKDDNFTNDTLIHEITHQVMDDYLTFLPKWIIEGTAEYTESLPYKSGIFRVESHKAGLKEHIANGERRGHAASIRSLGTHLKMNRQTWDGLAETDNKKMSELYYHSYLCVYFFCHLDGDGKGTRFIKFLDAVYGEVKALRDFFADPRVKKFPDGRFSYPTSFPPPDMKSDTAPFKHLDVLLEGRSMAQLANEMKEAYKKVGEKFSAGE